VIGGSVLGIVLGALQVTTGSGTAWYPYPISNFGVATGFFANGNHMAMLLAATIPFLFAIVAIARQDKGKAALQRRSGLIAVAVGTLLLMLLGLALNGSLAGLGLGAATVIAGAILLLPPEKQRRWISAPLLLLFAAVAIIFTLPVSGGMKSAEATSSIETRREVTNASLAVARDYMPVGAGPGSFEQVYRLKENPASVDRVFVNHAHNDYLEIAVEMGLPGLIMIGWFLLWWGSTARQRWGDGPDDPFAKAAVIASAAILAHSLVDFPLRTSALAALFAFCIALMAQSRPRAREAAESELWPRRHMEIR
jgi:O-antigen ligase